MHNTHLTQQLNMLLMAESASVLATDRQTGLPSVLTFYGDLHALLMANVQLSLIVAYLDLPEPHADSDPAVLVARVLAEACEQLPQARIYRTATDAFALVLPEVHRAEGLRLAECIRRQVAQVGDGLTLSLAVAGAPCDASEVGALIAACEVPLLVRSEAANHVVSVMPAESLPPATARLTNLLIARVVALVELSRRLSETERQALRDPITDLPNTRSLEQMLPRYLDRCSRAGAPLALLLVDGDSLKEFNTQLGYNAGNQWIRCITDVLIHHLRPGDYVARWFVGDEFVVLLPETDAEHALDVAERLRAAVERAGKAIAGFGTVSIGVALSSTVANSSESLLSAARDALVLAKRRGKNQVALAEG